jgi:hypothetical protein
VLDNSSAVPEPLPTQTHTQTGTVQDGASFAGSSGFIDSRYTGSVSPEIVHNEYRAWTPTGVAQQLQQFGATFAGTIETKTQTERTSERTVYTRPRIEVTYPFKAGTAWDGTAAFQTIYSGLLTYAGNHRRLYEDRVWNGDGSYTDHSLNRIFMLNGPNLGSYVNVASDGAATIDSFSNGKKTLSMSIGVPVQNAAGGYGIPFNMEPGVGKTTIPDWYPGGGLPPSPMVKATVVDRGRARVPSVCHLPHDAPASAEEIVRTQSQFDPTGIVATHTDVSYYAARTGMLCQIAHDLSTAYLVVPPAAQPALSATIETVTSLSDSSAAARLRSATAPGAGTIPQGIDGAFWLLQSAWAQRLHRVDASMP